MKIVILSIKAAIPNELEPTGEVRPSEPGEYYYDQATGQVKLWERDRNSYYDVPILRPVEESE